MQENKYKGMRGEFKGDFTRDTFDPFKRYSRVLMQQGRVQLDADWNEKTSIILHQLRNLACDFGSDHWGPAEGAGFEIKGVGENDFSIGAGHYYVKGILCEAGTNGENGGSEEGDSIRYSMQPDYPLTDEQVRANIISGNNNRYLVYLDVWERYITYLDDNGIREVALGGPDTATRAKIVWQVKVIRTEVDSNARTHPLKKSYDDFLNEIVAEIKPGTGKLCAKVRDKTGDDNDPCLVVPESRYRGAENQLYRVEIHTSGGSGTATFKWSRENASVIFPVTKIEGNHITLEHLGRDCRYGLKPKDWVEIVDDDLVLRCEPGFLGQIVAVKREELTVTIDEGDAIRSYANGDYKTKHVLLRRWDQKEGDKNVIVAGEGSLTADDFIDLEDGIQIQFKASGGGEALYQTGDYWLVPARAATGDIEWPKDDNDNPKAILPHGVVHHYAPLGIITVNGDVSLGSDLRRIIISKNIWG